MAQMKKQDKTLEKQLNKKAKSNLSDVELKTLVYKDAQRTQWGPQ